MSRPSTRFLSFAKHFAEGCYWQNIVDVPDGQGLLQLGMVVDFSEEGIRVDFLCKGHPPRLVPYGSLFRCSRYTEDADDDDEAAVEDADKVQVLLRVSTDVPFTWFAAKLLDTDTHLNPPRLVEVELELAGAVVKEIVHSSQIRNVPADGTTTVIQKGYFGIGSWAVPDRYASSFSEGSLLWKICIRELPYRSLIHPIRMCHGNMEYLVREGGLSMAAKELARESVEDSLDQALRCMECHFGKGSVWSGRFFTKAPVTMLPDDSPTCISVPVPWLSFLPAHLLGEIFQFLGSVTRVRQRRVCTLWDCVLSTETLFLDVWVCPKKVYGCPFRWPVSETVHAVVLSMTTLVTKSTKWMIIEGSGDYCCNIHQYIEEPLRLIADVARYFELSRAGKLKFLISQCSWSLDCNVRLQYGVEELAALCRKIASICDCLVWKNCTFEDDSLISFSVLQVRRGLIKPASSTLQADIWEMLDSNAPEPSLDEIAQWLDEGNHPEDTKFVKCVLEHFQIREPRLAAQSMWYRGDELVLLMEQDNWEKKLDIRRLSRLTLWALSDRIRQESHLDTEHPFCRPCGMILDAGVIPKYDFSVEGNEGEH